MQQPGMQQKRDIAVLNNVEYHIHKMFLAGIVFGAICCFARADFNLPLFAFLYLMWAQDEVSINYTIREFS